MDTSSATGGWTQVKYDAALGDQKWRRHYTDLPYNSQSYQYKAITTTGDFTHQFDFSFDAYTGGTCYTMPYALTDTVTTFTELYADASAHAITIRAADRHPTTSYCSIIINENDAGTTQQIGSDIQIPVKYRYTVLHFTLERSSTTLTLSIYRDADRTELLYSTTGTLNSAQTYDYVMLASGHGGATTTSQLGPLSDMTLVDCAAGGCVTVDGNEITLSDVDRDEDVYLYKDFGANYFNEIDHYFTLEMDSTTVNPGIAGIGFANTLGSVADFGTTDIFANIYKSGATNYNIYLFRGHGVALDSYACSVDTTYYCHLERAEDNDTVTLKIYSDAYSTLLDTLTVSGYGTSTEWRYGYGMVNRNTSASGADFDGTITHGVYSTNKSSGWVGNFSVTADSVFNITGAAPLMYADDSEDFDGFPTTGGLTWTTSGTIAESTDWSSDGDGKSAKSVDGGYAYFTPSNTDFAGCVLNFDYYLDSLETDGKSNLFQLSNGWRGWVQDVSGTKYFRIYHSTQYTTSSVTTVECELDTEYNITFAYVPVSSSNAADSGAVGLWVDGVLADKKVGVTINQSITSVRISNAGASTTTSYFDNLKYQSGISYFPSIARGGTSQGTLVASFIQHDNHFINDEDDAADVPINDAITQIMSSADDGETWTHQYSFAPTATEVYYCIGVRWCAADSNFYFFMHMRPAGISTNTYTRVYKAPASNLTSMSLVYDYYVSDSRNFQLVPTRELDSNGYLYVSLHDADTSYLKSARFDFSDGSLSSEYQIASTTAISGGTLLEPMIWHDSDDDQLCMMRYTTGSPNYIDDNYFMTSTDDGTSNWSGTPVSPGDDWLEKMAWMRAFVFNGSAYWQGRDEQGRTEFGDYRTFLVRSDTDATNAEIEMETEAWWDGLQEAGNGDVDANTAAITQSSDHLYLDYVSDTGTSWFYRIDTGESGIGTNGDQVIFF